MKDWIWIAFGLLFLGCLMQGCAHHAPVCEKPPSTYDICESKCPGGRAFIVENSTDVACYCGKPPEGT